MKEKAQVHPIPDINTLIFTVRDQRVMVDADLARIYGVPARVLNQAVKRNSERFPDDFMFHLTKAEAEYWHRLRSQIVILKRGQHLKTEIRPLLVPTEPNRREIGFHVKPGHDTRTKGKTK